MASGGGTGRVEERSGPPTKPPTNGKPLVIERLTHEDIPAICALYKRVWDAFRPELSPELLKAWEPTPLEFSSWMEGVTYFAARREGKMIGAIGCEIADGTCRIVHLATDPEARRAGVASALVAAAIDWARKSGCHSLWADTLARFTAAAPMFMRLGFTSSGVLHRHFLGEDVSLFEMVL